MNYDDLADLYDHQYDLYRDDLHHYARLADASGGPVLELGAGTGRVSVYLARRGVNVTGLEPSDAMRRRAQERAQRSRVDVTLVPGDMRDFDLGARFPLVIAPFNALMHLYSVQEQADALNAIARHVQPGGTFAFDLYTPHFGPQGVVRHEGETFTVGDARTDVLVYQQVHEAQQHVTTQYFVDTTGADGVVRRTHRTLTQRYYTRYEVEWMLRATGFTQIRVAGSFEGGPFTNDSRVMVVTAKGPA
ncbi:class I SAM-dependent methyltransferase [Deinococcus maricopensis]|uniref:Methyltransferase type 11 n=1 Tax=Deinococcus maricopensis (strain DSM 21211 / LMG 22137 / NRRL B-23946 / LB-34) TaxID=709986 RepID=E8UBR8_DEIML|nr:class I SAM-dependent methyltransferase [Deinococcus maricopensis]ADV68507.1 Methyltransferase type 11 [Deinococcus maricopensis DSM 21211]